MVAVLLGDWSLSKLVLCLLLLVSDTRCGLVDVFEWSLVVEQQRMQAREESETRQTRA